MADVIDFPITKDPALAEMAYAFLNFMKAQQNLNATVEKAFRALDVHTDLQNTRITTLEYQNQELRRTIHVMKNYGKDE